ncbi:DUF1176 domain-containing protein [Sphingomonas arantia]|uniref:DUF1176 domain-containing protein n=1 Tax=Sphingomonas arantia TaxID=1460676 RepID=A0ABW4TSU0_9SPHN
MRRPLSAALLLLATPTVPAIAAPPPGTIQSYDTYGEWFVACDNTLTCVARGFPADSYQGGQIEIVRAAGPQGTLTASIDAERRFTLADIRIDGKPAILAAPAWRRTPDGENSIATTDPAEIRRLVRQLRDASKVTLGRDATVPLTGFAAAMLRIDARQGRVNGVTALLKPGSTPATRVPAAPPLPRISARAITAKLAPGEARRLIAAVRTGQKALFAREDCEANPNAMTPEAHALDARRALVLIPCLMGAYQGSSLAFIAPRAGGPSRQLFVQQPYLGNAGDRSTGAYFTEAEFDPATGRLAMVAKGRGLADCGMSATSIWDGERFRLSELAFQQACGGMSPGDWPTLFRSAN